MHVSARRSLLSLLAFALAMALACTGSGEDDRVAAPAPPTASATAAESATPAPVATPTRAATAAPTPAPAVTPTATVVALPAPTPTATATPPPTAELPATRCATTTAADCIRAVYRGAPADYAQVADIPADKLLTPGSDGRYRVERGQQYTVVTAAPLPEGWTRFWLDLSPLEFGTPSPVSASQLIPPVGTTYTFTVSEDEAASTLITFDLKEARPFVRPRPDGKPEIGDTVVTTVFSVETSSPRYNSYDTTGAVATAGSYAFLSDPADTTSAVTTYEALRDGTTTALLIHKSDAHGASQAALYDAVEAGDLFEWQYADDCWVGFRVTEVRPDPAGPAPRVLLGITKYGYAYTGCSGAIRASATAQQVWRQPLVRGGASLSVPTVYGAFQLAPINWASDLHQGSFFPPPSYSTPLFTENIAVARTLPYWRDFPQGWNLVWASSGGTEGDDPLHGYCSEWELPELHVVQVCGFYASARLFPAAGKDPASGRVNELRVINGYPAAVSYNPDIDPDDRGALISVYIYDEGNQAVYGLKGVSYSTLGRNVETLVEIASSLLDE